MLNPYLRTLYLGFLFTCLSLLVATGPAPAFDAPSFQGDVLDETGVLAESDRAILLARIRDLRDSGDVWAAIYVARSLQSDSIEQAALQTFESWKLGQSGKDNGLLIMIVPSERRMRIEVGYGLEGFITDAFSKRVIEEQFKPAFREERYAEGLMAGLDILAAAARGEIQTRVESEPLAPPQVEIDLNGAAIRFGLSLVGNFAPVPLYLLARRYGRARGRVGKLNDAGDIRMMAILCGFFGLFFGLFYAVFGAALAEDPEVLPILVGMNTLFAFVFSIPMIGRVRTFLSGKAYRRQRAHERLLRLRKRSGKARNIFGVWFDPETVGVSRGGTKYEPPSSSSSSDSTSSSGSSSSSGGGRSGGGGASGSW